MSRTGYIALLLLPVMVISLISGCAQQADTPSGDAQAISETSAAQESTKTVFKSDIPEGTDYEGGNFNIYTYDTSNGTWYDVDFSATEETGDTLNDAVYKRMRSAEEKLNIKIVAHLLGGSGDAGKLKNSVKAADGAYDSAFLNTFQSVSTAQAGYLLDLKNISRRLI